MDNPFAILVLTFVGCALGTSAYKTLFVPANRRQVLAVIRAWQWRYLPGTIAMLFGVGLVGGGLDHFLPWTRWGWWHLVGGEGNPALGLVDLGSSPAGLATSAALAIIFPLIFGVAAIREARSEEVSFRKGNQKLSPRRRFARAIWFGLIHCIVGIPIYAGFALTVPGLWLDYVYQRGYERTAARFSRESAQGSLLGVLRARGRELARVERERKAKDAYIGHWAYAYALGLAPSVMPPTPATPPEEYYADAANSRLYENFHERYVEAEEAGVNTAAAQHAFYNLLIIVIVEIVVLTGAN